MMNALSQVIVGGLSAVATIRTPVAECLYSVSYTPGRTREPQTDKHGEVRKTEKETPQAESTMRNMPKGAG